MENRSSREVMQLAAAGALVGAVGAVGATAAPAQSAAGLIVDANMHWRPENLFTDEKLLSAFVETVPREWLRAPPALENS